MPFRTQCHILEALLALLHEWIVASQDAVAMMSAGIALALAHDASDRATTDAQELLQATQWLSEVLGRARAVVTSYAVAGEQHLVRRITDEIEEVIESLAALQMQAAN